VNNGGNGVFKITPIAATNCRRHCHSRFSYGTSDETTVSSLSSGKTINLANLFLNF